ncbi:MAG: PKD domain-containing protein [Chitinophagales bacterium]
MKKHTFFLILYILPYILLAQNKYFEKQYNWTWIEDAYNILQNTDTTFLISGSALNDDNFLITSYSMEINQYGEQLLLNEYIEPNYETIVQSMIATEYGFFICGWGDLAMVDAAGETYYVMVDNHGNYIQSDTLGNPNYVNHIYGCCRTADNGYFLVGELWLPQRYPYLLKLDSLGNQVWDSIYYNYNVANNLFKDIVPADDGTYYIVGSLAWNDTQSDVLFLNIDEQGTILWEETYNFGSKDVSVPILKSYEGGFLMPVRQSLLATDKILKLNEEKQIVWQMDNELLAVTPLQASDSSYIFTGFIITPAGDTNMGLLKVSQDGELLWRRQYGGSDNDYGYDIIETSDGDYIVCGRTESNSEGADLYVVKTNCMGLLTEPQADFVGDLDHENIIATAYNESQYVYPDSIDGGHFVWDFGDNTALITANNTASQTHTYTQAGKYTATLQAIVCNDTSIFKRTYCIGTTDATAVFEYENTDILGLSFSPQNTYHDANYIWHFGDENISYEQNPTHIYAQNGHYEVSLSIILCNDTLSFSQNILVDNVGFQENVYAENNDILIFPNPAKNAIFVETRYSFSKNKKYEIAIYNHLGQKVYENKNFITQNAINVQNLQQGSYFLHLKDEKSSIVKPFVIMK